mmetsp:Transcript_8238/g.24426  ORF Transcript_8238/g.24426 Transcript_8238/m.24426 type:complete len:290 (-) Transcript_8238:712-1581(-)
MSYKYSRLLLSRKSNLLAPFGFNSNQSTRVSCEIVARVWLETKSQTRMVIKSRRYAMTFSSLPCGATKFSSSEPLMCTLMRCGDMCSVRAHARTSLQPYSTKESSPALKIMHTVVLSKKYFSVPVECHGISESLHVCKSPRSKLSGVVATKKRSVLCRPQKMFIFLISKPTLLFSTMRAPVAKFLTITWLSDTYVNSCVFRYRVRRMQTSNMSTPPHSEPTINREPSARQQSAVTEYRFGISRDTVSCHSRFLGCQAYTRNLLKLPKTTDSPEGLNAATVNSFILGSVA